MGRNVKIRKGKGRQEKGEEGKRRDEKTKLARGMRLDGGSTTWEREENRNDMGVHHASADAAGTLGAVCVGAAW